MNKCLLIGSSILDITLNMPRLPLSGEDIEVSKHSVEAGGCAYNAACIMQNFECAFTLFSPLGDGIYGKQIQELMRSHCIHSPLLIPGTDNGFSVCIVEPSAERTFLTVSGIETQFRQEWLKQISIADYDSIYVSGYELIGDSGKNIVAFLEQNQNLNLYFTPGPRSSEINQDLLNRILSLHPITHINEKESFLLSGKSTFEDAARYLFGKTHSPVIITLGKNGAYLHTESLHSKVPPFPAQTLNTNGAGDAHIGTIMAMRQKKYTFEQSVLIANYISSLIVEQQGTVLNQKLSFTEENIYEYCRKIL